MSTIETTILTVILTVALHCMSLAILRNEMTDNHEAVIDCIKDTVDESVGEVLADAVDEAIEQWVDAIFEEAAMIGEAQAEYELAQEELEGGSFDPDLVKSIDLSTLLP